jgi:thiol-disulfide isomerase/thioredoxin
MMRSKRTVRTFTGLAMAGLVLGLISVGSTGSALALEPGQPAPGFVLPSLEDDSQKISLKSYRGKVVWLDFWASWCAPCLTAMPELEKLRQQLPAKDVQIVAVNLDQDPKKALKFLAKNPVGYPSASDVKGGLPQQFGVKTMPTSYLIDRKGVVRLVHPGFRRGDIETIREEILALVKE